MQLRDDVRPLSSCRQGAGRAFWKYRCFRSSLLSDEHNLAGALPMREWLSSNRRNTQQSGRRSVTLILLSAALAACSAWLAPAAAIAQAISPEVQPSIGMRATSPLALRSTRPEAIPLGSTEIATRGVSPVSPSEGMGTCAGSGNTASPGPLFDGGGLSGGASLSCADSETAPSTLPSVSVRPTGLPLGATELGGGGLSPASPVPGPDLSGSAGSIDSSGNP
jgi:hypothetical protein